MCRAAIYIYIVPELDRSLSICPDRPFFRPSEDRKKERQKFPVCFTKLLNTCSKATYSLHNESVPVSTPYVCNTPAVWWEKRDRERVREERERKKVSCPERSDVSVAVGRQDSPSPKKVSRQVHPRTPPVVVVVAVLKQNAHFWYQEVVYPKVGDSPSSKCLPPVQNTVAMLSLRAETRASRNKKRKEPRRHHIHSPGFSRDGREPPFEFIRRGGLRAAELVDRAGGEVNPTPRGLGSFVFVGLCGL